MNDFDTEFRAAIERLDGPQAARTEVIRRIGDRLRDLVGEYDERGTAGLRQFLGCVVELGKAAAEAID